MNRLNQKVLNAELDAFVSTSVRTFEADKKAQKNVFVSSQIGELKTQHTGMNTAILKDKGYSMLSDLDSARDDKFSRAKKISDAYDLFPIEAKRALNAPIKALFEKYAKSGLTAASYKAESALIESFKGDLKPYAENVAALEGLKEALDELFEAEDAFLKASDEYTQALNGKTASASSYKKPMLSIINDNLVVYLSAMIVANDADCADFAKAFATEIDRTNAAVAKRSAKPQQPQADSPQADSPQADSPTA